LSFKQAKKLGGTVRKGEKGSPILYFTVVEDKKDPQKTFPIFKYTPMFNVEQCDLPFEIETENKNIGDPIVECEAIINRYPIEAVQTSSQLYGSYSKELNVIKMPEMKQFASIEEYYSTYFHEMIHSTAPTLGRKKDRATEELIAEIGSAMMCNEAGLGFAHNTEIFKNQVAYIQGWMKQIEEKPQILITAASEASKAVECILNLSTEEVAA